MNDTIHLDELRSLVALHRAGDLRGAALALRSSEPVLLRRMRGLESKLGTTLLVRGRGGLVLSPPGQALAEASGVALNRLRSGVVAVGGSAALIRDLSLPSAFRDVTERPRSSPATRRLSPGAAAA